MNLEVNFKNRKSYNTARYPTRENVSTKLALATEEIHQYALRQRKQKRQAALT